MPVEASPLSGSATDDESLAVDMRDRDDHSAYLALLDRYTRAVLAYCRSRTHRANDAEDVAQDVWLKVWSRRDQFTLQGTASFRRWLFTIAGHTCIDSNRKKRPDPTADEFFVDRGDPADVAPDWIACLAERRQALEACIAELPTRQRCVVRATLAGDKAGAAAEKCQCTAPQASTAKHQAIQSLQACTERKGV